MALDLPAFERPANATSAPRSAGNWAAWAAESTKRTLGKTLTDKDGEVGGSIFCVVYNSPPFAQVL
jgi:hypothetical protein